MQRTLYCQNDILHKRFVVRTQAAIFYDEYGQVDQDRTEHAKPAEITCFHCGGKVACFPFSEDVIRLYRTHTGSLGDLARSLLQRKGLYLQEFVVQVEVAELVRKLMRLGLDDLEGLGLTREDVEQLLDLYQIRDRVSGMA